MGMYLNSSKSETLYRNIQTTPYFVDKSLLLKELFPLVESGNQYICITRPRRFGKTVMANMIGCFFGKGNCEELFNHMKISREFECVEHMNHHNVVYIPFNEMPRRDKNYNSYIERIEGRLLKDLMKEYPAARISQDDALWDAFNAVHETYQQEKFIFVLDEWDFIFHRDFVSQKDKMDYIAFLSNLLKDQPYVELAYMTGILPIAKYSSGSELNMFTEYTMNTQHLFGDYFGFTESEVDILYNKYMENTAEPRVSRDGLRLWYDGYHTLAGERLYNPRSVVLALSNNQLSDYWTSSGPYDEIYYYVKNNIADVQNDVALMLAGESIEANVQEYAATSTEIKTRDQIISAMVVYGFLTSDSGKVCIPNRELMNKFVDMVNREQDLGYIYRLAKESDRMLQATKCGDTKTMVSILQQAHDTETGMTGYNNEAELSAIIKLVYLSARNQYDIQREDKSGVGYVDYIFYPTQNMADDCIIVELKVDHTADEAIQQIKDRNYMQRFVGKIGENVRYRGRILAVGISYFKDDMKKKHECKVEVLRDRM